jgi:hypothetical protein
VWVIKIVGYYGERVHSAGCCNHGNEPSGSIKYCEPLSSIVWYVTLVILRVLPQQLTRHRSFDLYDIVFKRTADVSC